MTEHKTRVIERFETVAFTALPEGWQNVFDCDGVAGVTQCPGVLTQELRATEYCTDVPDSGGKSQLSVQVETHEPPYQTRVVFADFCTGALDPACDLCNYVETLPPNTPIPNLKGRNP